MQGRVLKCVELIRNLSLNNVAAGVGSKLPYVPQSPMGVMDAAGCLSYKSDELTVRSCLNSSHDSPNPNTKISKADGPNGTSKWWNNMNFLPSPKFI